MITLAFYKGTKAENPKAKLFDRLVCAWPKSAGRFSHVELVVRRSSTVGWCWSSSARDGGVRAKEIELATGRWVLVDLPGADLARALAWFSRHHGRPYDYPGILGYVLPLVKQWRRWWYCSEACAAAIDVDGGSHIPPNKLFAWAAQRPGARVYELAWGAP